MGVCMMPNFSEMSNAQLKQYLAEHRNDDDVFSEALSVLMSRRDPSAPRYNSELPIEEIQKIIQDKLNQTN
jgi:hypothetical protein